ncbi:MAG: response regulator [Candidatus Sericytochromatia bacterium]
MSAPPDQQESPTIANILLVDDTPANLKVLTELLKEYHYKVRAVPSGKLALKSVEHRQPDLILLDINMPEMNGYEVCQHLKDNPITANIPVIFISALDDIQDKVQAFRQGGVDYITKPFQIEEVHARIKTHLTIGELQKELKQKNSHLESQLCQLQEMEAMQDTLVHMVVHDIKVPLTGATLLVSHMDATSANLPPRVAAQLQETSKIMERMNMALQNILDLGKMEWGKLTLKYETLELVSALKAWLQEIETLSAHVQLEIQFPQEPLDIEADPRLLKRIVFNLLMNAFRYTTEGKKVQIKLLPEKERFCLAISDQGPGVPEEYRESIFEKYVQIQLSHKNDPASSGLGLAFCKMAIEAHHGHIGLESEVGQGSTFWFTLPRKAPLFASDNASLAE